MYTCTHIYTYIYIYVHMYTYICICLQDWNNAGQNLVGWDGLGWGGGRTSGRPTSIGVNTPTPNMEGEGCSPQMGEIPIPLIVELGVIINGGQCTPISGGRCTHVEGNPPIREYTPIRGVPPKPYGVMPRRACSQTRALLACRLLPQGGRREGAWRKQTRHGDLHFPIRRGLPYLQLWKS